MGYGHPDGTSPDMTVVDYEAGQEILVFTSRDAITEMHTDHLAARAAGAIPRAVKRRENISAIVRWKRGRTGCVYRIKSHLQGSGMRLHRHIRRNHMIGQIRPCAGVARVFVISQIVPRPPVISALP